MYFKELCILLCTVPRFMHGELNVMQDRTILASDSKLNLPDNF